MTRIIASGITVLFILFLLRLDRKQNPAASLALWVPTLWILFFLSRSPGIWFGSSGLSMDEGNPFDRVFLGALLLIGLLILFKRYASWVNGIKDNPWLMLLIGYMLISVLWSDIPFVSFKRWNRSAANVIVMALVVAAEVDPRQALMSIFRRVIYVHIPLSFLLIRYYPSLGVQFRQWTGDRMWVGVSTQKNGLALICLFAIFFLLWTFIRRWRKRDISVTWYQAYIEVLLVILTIWLFMGPNHTLTYSATSLGTLAVGSTALICLLWLKGKNITLGANALTVIISLLIIYGTTTPFTGGFTIINPSELLGRDPTLTNRSDNIWAVIIPHAMQNPLLGHGFGGFWTDEMIGAAHGASDAHNGYLDTILNIGFTGLMFSSIFLISSSRKAQMEMMQDFDWGIFWFCIVLMTVVHNISESSIGKLTGLMSILIFVNICLSTAKTNHEESSKEIEGNQKS
ncbi:MAG: O-antigen ligase family protein [Syntrophus sp. (in: bacteria)]